MVVFPATYSLSPVTYLVRLLSRLTTGHNRLSLRLRGESSKTY
jgi:hypothetical protein